MRAAIPGLATPAPIGDRMPAAYLDDGFTARFTQALDEVLAPVFLTLDCLADYLDPQLAPADFVDWLCSWVALPVDGAVSLEQRRRLLSEATELHRWRGTRYGLHLYVQVLTGGEVEVVDSGGCRPSDTPGADLPGTADAGVVVRVGVRNPAAADLPALRRALRALTPAHVTLTVEVAPL